MAILWKRANRWGAMASFVAAILAAGLANFAFNWKGDAGLPWTITLYLSSGIIAGVVVSLLTPPEDPRRTEQFFLLLKTPIGQEHVLREAGFRELPGNDTYEMPIDAMTFPPVTEAPAHAFEPTMATSGGVATAVAHAPAPAIPIADAMRMIDLRQARRQARVGVIIFSIIVVVMLVGINILAAWLRP
jgi:Na+/proline symporter